MFGIQFEFIIIWWCNSMLYLDLIWSKMLSTWIKFSLRKADFYELYWLVLALLLEKLFFFLKVSKKKKAELLLLRWKCKIQEHETILEQWFPPTLYITECVSGGNLDSSFRNLLSCKVYFNLLCLAFICEPLRNSL